MSKYIDEIWQKKQPKCLRMFAEFCTLSQVSAFKPECGAVESNALNGRFLWFPDRKKCKSAQIV